MVKKDKNKKAKSKSKSKKNESSADREAKAIEESSEEAPAPEDSKSEVESEAKSESEQIAEGEAADDEDETEAAEENTEPQAKDDDGEIEEAKKDDGKDKDNKTKSKKDSTEAEESEEEVASEVDDAGTDDASQEKIEEPKKEKPKAKSKMVSFYGLLGAIAAGAGLAVSELVAALINAPGPLVAVASRVIENAPMWLVDVGRAMFDTNNKFALGVGILIITTIVGYFALRTKKLEIFGAVLGVFGLLSILAIASDPQASFFHSILLTLITVVTALVVAIAGQQVLEAKPEPVSSDTGAPVAADNDGRRKFFGFAVSASVLTALAGFGAFSSRGSGRVDADREAVTFRDPQNPEILDELAGVEADQITVPVSEGNITPYVQPVEDYYLIDTAVVKPTIDADSWTLTINGMVDQEVVIDYAQLVEMSTTIAPVTLSCVSNPIGGDLVGNAVWQGVPLSEVLEMAGVQDGAEQIASRSVDGWTCGFPVEAAFDGRTAMLCVGMNGEPLVQRHGFPARLVVSGLYGYVSATKWIEEITLTTWDGFDGFWIPRGWGKRGPVKLQSRIDLPGTTVSGSNSAQPIAGIAWAPNTGVSKVELRFIDEPANGGQVDLSAPENNQWVEAEIGPTVNKDTWVQWIYNWDVAAYVAERGADFTNRVVLQVRATDANGDVQIEEITEVAPDGATGFHTRGIEITA